MGTAKNLLSAIGFGAGCMYLYDPQCGKRRRSVLRDRLLRATRRAGVWLDRAVRDAENRIQGTAAEFEALFDAHPPSNEKLEGRVRAQLGHVASHPHLVQVRADNGRITLTGHAPLAEMHAIIAAAYGVRGVCSIDNRLDDHLPPQAAANPRRRARAAGPAELLAYDWAPATRLFAGLTGGVLMLNCTAKRSPAAMLLGTLGFGLFLKAAQPPHRAIGAGPRERLGARPAAEKAQEFAGNSH